LKNDKQIKEDTNGRIHSLDQSQRSFDKRLRAVERRISSGNMDDGEDLYIDAEFDNEEFEQLKEEIAKLKLDHDGLKTAIVSADSLSVELQDVKIESSKLSTEIEELRKDNSKMHRLLEQNISQGRGDISIDIKNELNQLNIRLEKTEKRDRINIGSVKVPVELSGIIGAGFLTLTGVLIMQSRWDIIRSPYFSFGIALVFAVAVLIKFYVVNRSAK
jgi:predicted  nucleic acid-binding Zn-ribbon protein